MSWLISRVLMENYENSRCSPEPEEEYSAANCSGGGQFALLNVMPTQHQFLHNDITIDLLTHSLFGPMSAPLTESRGADLLTWYREDFLVKISAPPAKEQELRESDPVCGLSSLASLAKFDPDTCSWKTPQYSLLGGSELFLETWPRWGLMQGGECWEQKTLAHRTGEIGSGLWQTPTANTYGSCQGGSGGRDGQKNRPSLNTMAAKNMWPTPLANDAEKRGNFDINDPRNGLGAAVKRKSQVGGALNPDWVEWLMGWKISMTSLEPIDIIMSIIWEGMTYDAVRRSQSSSKNVCSRSMQCLWFEKAHTQTSPGHGSNKQYSGEHTNIMRKMSHQSAYEFDAGAICSDATMCRLWKSISSKENKEGEDLLRRVFNRNGENFSKEALEKPGDNKELCLLWRAIQTKEGESKNLFAFLWEQARMGKTWWESDPSINGLVPRVAKDVANRKYRLMCIGNGQVPQCAAEAWRLLK